MGWTSCETWKRQGDVVKALLKERTATWLMMNGVWVKDECLSHTVTTRGMWSVWERAHLSRLDARVERFITFDLMERTPHGWAYKDMDEMVHPYYYDCPLEYLDMAPVACEEWRAKVREYWAGVPQLSLLRGGTTRTVTCPECGEDVVRCGAHDEGVLTCAECQEGSEG